MSCDLLHWHFFVCRLKDLYRQITYCTVLILLFSNIVRLLYLCIHAYLHTITSGPILIQICKFLNFESYCIGWKQWEFFLLNFSRHDCCFVVDAKNRALLIMDTCSAIFSRKSLATTKNFPREYNVIHSYPMGKATIVRLIILGTFGFSEGSKFFYPKKILNFFHGFLSFQKVPNFLPQKFLNFHGSFLNRNSTKFLNFHGFFSSKVYKSIFTLWIFRSSKFLRPKNPKLVPSCIEGP